MQKGLALIASFVSILLFIYYLARNSISKYVYLGREKYRIVEGISNLWVTVPKNKVGNDLDFTYLIKSLKEKIRKEVKNEYKDEIGIMERKIEQKEKRYRNLKNRVEKREEEISEKKKQLGGLRKKTELLKTEKERLEKCKEEISNDINVEKNKLKNIKKSLDNRKKELNEREKIIREKEIKIERDMEVIERWEKNLKRNSVWYNRSKLTIKVNGFRLSSIWRPMTDWLK